MRIVPTAPSLAAASPPAGGGMPPIPGLAGVSQHFVTVNGIRMHYAEAGSGPPVVLIHGFPENWYMWRGIIPGLAEHYRVIALDMPGAGWSDPSPTGYLKAHLADQVADFMTAVGAPRARVMGHDWGGFVGFQLALRHPQQVSQYLALDIATPWPGYSGVAEALNAWRVLYQPVLAAPGIGPGLLRQRSFIKAMLWAASSRHVWSDADVDAIAGPYADPAHAEAGSQMYRSFLRHEIVPWVTGAYNDTRLEPQTLLLVGEHDLVIRPGLIAGYERHSRDMRAEYVPDAGHFLPEERPDVVLGRALSFFAGGDPA